MTGGPLYARPDLPDPSPRAPEQPHRAAEPGDGSTVYDFFTPPERTPAPGYAAVPHDPPTIELVPVVPAAAEAHPRHPATLVEPLGQDGDDPGGPLYVVGDIHGYLQELLDGLHAEGLIDAEGHWSAGRSRIWFLGDFTDRGPDGIGVIDLVMQLAAEAAAAGGYCRALMGNHELLLLGADRYGDQAVQSSAGTASFLAAWRLNGGQPTDMERLEDHHVAWLTRLPAMVVEDDHLLLHSDTTAYLEYGDSVDAVNDAIHEVLNRGDGDEWWDCFRRLTKRFAFRGDAGPASARELLDAFGGERVVHGHSPIPYLLGDTPAEDGHPAQRVTGPHVYADDLAVAMDGGVTMEGEGRLLIARLPLEQTVPSH
ncbi:metallophosphoesterase [Streptacidiphilus sp. N1-12]|uniref:Metallophosphoesterase n=2 Tax=Streptacidiphilus alkalitolerans TaxID=3342712 RepID=A0ABV6WEW7_9ACTN